VCSSDLFGALYLFIAMGVAVTELAAVFYWSDYWSQQADLALGLLTGLVVLPMFNWLVIDRLYGLSHRLEHLVAERTRELENLNAELARAGRAKDEFLATMSHELRTPLAAVLGLSQLLADPRLGQLTAKQLGFVKSIEESGNHLLELITDILDVARIEADYMKLDWGTARVPELCESALRIVEPMARNKGIEPGLDIDPRAQSLHCDPRRVKQMLVNLLGNAVKFTPAGGRLGLRVRADPDAGNLLFEVWDTGIGIAQDDLPRLFKPFIQLDSRLARQYEGTGLGLVLVYRMVDLHGGCVAVQSSPGEGSQFSLCLPWSPPGAAGARYSAETAAPARCGNGQAQPLHVLVAEDNKAITELLRTYLEGDGYRVSQAWDGLQAVDLTRSLRPGLVLMDIQMPALDGLQAIRRIRADASLATTPIVALSALAMPGDRERCLAAGADAYLTKPVPLAELRHTLGRFAMARG
jgi:signal transduction histidine kinase